MSKWLAEKGHIIPIVVMMLGTGMIGYSLGTGQNIGDVSDPPDYERIENMEAWLEVEDKGRKTMYIRRKMVNGFTHWLPGQHPEQRPWDAIEAMLGASKIRIDCKDSEDAAKIVKLLKVTQTSGDSEDGTSSDE